jgi:hypothetical protein
MVFQHNGKSAVKGSARHRQASACVCRVLSRNLFWLLIAANLASPSTVVLAKSRTKTDKFEGYIVHVGSKAITVKNKNNIYQVRTFSYSPKLEEKIRKRNLAAGKMVTVHYMHGTDVALKLD